MHICITIMCVFSDQQIFIISHGETVMCPGAAGIGCGAAIYATGKLTHVWLVS
jgi:hypothetical protein